jgi:1-acyl-sn-glycerol-3-phosphate acyltransferase
MIKKLRSLFFFPLYLGGMAFFFILLSPLLFFPKSLAYLGLSVPARYTIWLVKWFGGIEYEFRGLDKFPKNNAFIIASQHQSSWEAYIFYKFFKLPIFIIKRELFHIPFAGWFGFKLGMIGVNRKGKRGVIPQMVEKAKKTLEKGGPLVIFPEGTRVPLGKKVPLKKGIGFLYKGLDVPVYPVVLTSGYFWHKSTLLNQGKLILEVLDPIHPGLSQEEFMETLTTQIDEAHSRISEETKKTLHT